jgi:16S rRNA C1402 (ribose-2'-O) methylase RsmI
MPVEMTEEFAALYVVATPLGNLADLTRRGRGARPSRRVVTCGIRQVGVIIW